MRKRNLLIASLVVAGLVAGAVWFLRPTEAPVAETQDAAATIQPAAAALKVQSVLPEVVTWPVEVLASGRLTPWAEAHVSSEVGGERIVAIKVEVGDEVKAGDVLIELSRATLENRIAELQATLDSAQVALETATTDASRARQLSGGDSMSQQQINEYLSAERNARASVTVAEAQLASAQLALENTRITAVSDGVVSEVSAALGQVVTEGQELLRLIRDNRVEWQAEVPLFQLRGIETGTRVAIPTPFGEVGGSVRHIAPTTSLTNGRVLVYVDLEPPADVPMPKTGLLISGAFIVEETEALVLPTSALTMQDGFSYVFVIEGAGESTSVSRQRVDTGRQRGSQVEILGDFSAEIPVVLSGGAFLSDGSVVRVVPSAKATAAVKP